MFLLPRPLGEGWGEGNVFTLDTAIEHANNGTVSARVRHSDKRQPGDRRRDAPTLFQHLHPVAAGNFTRD